MPADGGLRFANYENLGPPGPDATQGGPEQPAPLIQPRAWAFPLEHGWSTATCMPQSEDLNCSVMPSAEEDSASDQESKDELEHEPYVVT